MNSANIHPPYNNAARRRLPVEWLEPPDALPVMVLSERKTSRLGRPSQCANPSRFSIQHSAFSISKSSRAFTVLELLLVVAIIGFMAALALPHLGGFTKSSAMTVATRQMLDDANLARQLALAKRSTVCMVFLTPNFWLNDITNNQGVIQTATFSNSQMTALVGHQYAAYALISLRTVGDQPGRSNAHYLTDWKFLPQGVYFAPFIFTNNLGVTPLVSTTNTTTGVSNGWYMSAFPSNINFPFPSASIAISNNLPYIAFTPGGQLAIGADQFIMLTSGSIFYPLDVNGVPQWQVGAPNSLLPVETPPGNEFNNPNLIHIDWLTARAKIERNQF